MAPPEYYNQLSPHRFDTGQKSSFGRGYILLCTWAHIFKINCMFFTSSYWQYMFVGADVAAIVRCHLEQLVGPGAAVIMHSHLEQL